MSDNRTILFLTVVLCAGFGWGTDAAAAESAAPLLRPEIDPDSWCATGEDLDAYLEALASLPAPRRVAGMTDAPADPVVVPIEGVLVIEDSGVILRRDRVFDLPLQSIELIPSGAGYQVLSVPPAYEPLSVQDRVLFLGQSTWRSEPLTLSRFAFPFGGVNRTQLWITPTNLVAFEPPVEPVKVGLCSEGCYFDEGQVLLDRLPRVSPLQHGSSFYGWNAYEREESDRLVITWQYDDPANLDVQAVLFADGRIRFNYAAVSGIPWGAVVAVTGNDALWADLRLGGDATDPAGDVTIPAPDGPALDIVSASARQVGTTELLQVELTLAAPPPPNQEERILYRVELRNHSFDEEPIGGVVLQWQNGQFYWATEPVRIEGSTLRMNLRLFDLPLTDGAVYLDFTTLRGGSPWEEGDELRLQALFEPPVGPLMLDLTTDLPVTLGDVPVYEAFTLPSLQTGEVLKVGAPLFEDSKTVEAFPIFQNLWTDIIFFAGGYHAGGNAGADGTGFGSSALPRSPSLLHLNSIYNYGPEDGAMLVMSHELGHRWLYHFAIEENGEPSRILNPAGGHPAGWVHTPAVRPVYFPLDYSVMGGSNWQDNGNGTFSSPPEDQGGGNGFSWHELYLIGLADPAEVADWWYIEDAFPPLPNAYWAPNDTTVIGTRVPVTVDQIIAVEGPRFPAYPDAPQDFLAPIVLVVRPGQYIQDEIDTVKSLCSIWQVRFNEATDLRGTVRCFFHPPVVSITSPPSDVTIFARDTVDFTGSASDGDGDPVELRWDFSDAAPDAVGPGPHAVTFDSTGTYPIRLDGVDGSGMLSVQPDTRTVTVECPSASPTDPVPSLRLGKEGADVRFTWTDLPDATLDYVVLMGDAPQGPFYPRGSAASGDPGLLLPVPAGNAFYKLAARNTDGCLGPY
jgi:hypothetical protein